MAFTSIRLLEISSKIGNIICHFLVRNLIEEHQKKLDDYIKDPYAHDNKEILQNAPNQEIRDKIIQGNVDALQKQIKT